ncbi:hypothetical protein GPECTOR_10g791 [Gonium pectorale]|uniref:Uncharacterized protein n=1 Tax=Gonium pectorale TaxID=33097 RepID=A0A150GQZ1_GONPE|nr:hypothetical protein GPECTOR_10g791 [Gonium pectorale]|eukprot:KXZ52162.1 hypothetical protein GPECTOR_10g791 [Gonium pectorale]
MAEMGFQVWRMDSRPVDFGYHNAEATVGLSDEQAAKARRLGQYNQESSRLNISKTSREIWYGKSRAGSLDGIKLKLQIQRDGQTLGRLSAEGVWESVIDVTLVDRVSRSGTRHVELAGVPLELRRQIKGCFILGYTGHPAKVVTLVASTVPKAKLRPEDLQPEAPAPPDSGVAAVAAAEAASLMTALTLPTDMTSADESLLRHLSNDLTAAAAAAAAAMSVAAASFDATATAGESADAPSAVSSSGGASADTHAFGNQTCDATMLRLVALEVLSALTLLAVSELVAAPRESDAAGNVDSQCQLAVLARCFRHLLTSLQALVSIKQ